MNGIDQIRHKWCGEGEIRAVIPLIRAGINTHAVQSKNLSNYFIRMYKYNILYIYIKEENDIYTVRILNLKCE